MADEIVKVTNLTTGYKEEEEVLKRISWVCIFFVVSILVFNGCRTILHGPTITITYFKTPIERSDEIITECSRILIANPGKEEYRAHLNWIELDAQGRIVDSGIRGEERDLYPGYEEEVLLRCIFPSSYYEPGLYTAVVQLITPGPDGVIGTDDDVVLAEDRENFELI